MLKNSLALRFIFYFGFIVLGFCFRITTIFVLYCCISSTSFAQVLQIDPKSVEAKAWIIYDVQSKQVIDGYKQNIQRAPASLTKMMVAYIALKAIEQQQLSLNQVITVPNIVQTVNSDESQLHLKAGEQITVQDLISGLIIMSANDAALTLATVLGGDVAGFLLQMNQTAQQLGMQNTHFSNTSGITMQDHYSSAFDLALLSQAIIQDTPEYLSYSKQQDFRYKDYYHEATNWLLKKDPTVDGFKTGYTEAAGYNFAATARRLDPNTQQYRRIIVVVMGTASKQKRADVAEKLMNIAFNYTQVKAFNPQQKLADIPVVGGKQPIYELKLSNVDSVNTFSLLPTATILNAQQFDPVQQRFILAKAPLKLLQPLSQPQQIDYSVNLLQQKLYAPLDKKNLALATVQIQQFNQPVHQITIVKDVQLTSGSWWQKMMHWFKSWVPFLQQPQPQAQTYPINAA